jgi:exonuclease 3'-5' domain-containing protein 1
VLVITDKEALGAAVQCIAQHSTIAIDCEGCNLSRTGRLCLVQVSLPPPKTCVYLFDLVSMDSDTLEALKQSLGTILEDRNVTKVIHDCRQDSDALFHQLGIRLDGVFDTQASYVALVKVLKAQACSTSRFVPLPGLNQLLKEYTGKENSAKQDGKVLMERVSYALLAVERSTL